MGMGGAPLLGLLLRTGCETEHKGWVTGRGILCSLYPLVCAWCWVSQGLSQGPLETGCRQVCPLRAIPGGIKGCGGLP